MLHAASTSCCSDSRPVRPDAFRESPQVTAWLGFHLQFSGRYQEAERELRKAIALDPSFGVCYQLLGEVFLKLEDYAEAVWWFRKARENAGGRGESHGPGPGPGGVGRPSAWETRRRRARKLSSR